MYTDTLSKYKKLRIQHTERIRIFLVFTLSVRRIYDQRNVKYRCMISKCQLQECNILLMTEISGLTLLLLQKNRSDSDNGSKGEFGTEDVGKAHFSGLLSASTKGLLVKNEKKK